MTKILATTESNLSRFITIQPIIYENHPAHLLRPHFLVRFMPINNSGAISCRTALHAIFSFLVIQQEV